MTIKKLTDIEGSRVISAWNVNGENGWRVGRDKVKSITLYNENGDMSPIAYLCIIFESGMEIRARASNYEVEILR